MGSLKLKTILEKTNTENPFDVEKEYDLFEPKTKSNEIIKIEDDIKDIKSDIKDIKKDILDLADDLNDDVGRMSYVRQLSGEFLEYLNTLDTELQGQVETPESNELMNKIMGRSERKKYYMSKFRL